MIAQHLKFRMPKSASPASVALASGLALSLGFFVAWAWRRHSRRTASERHVEQVRDKTLKDSFPASDPPASQFYGIPENRV
jgi:hypothetical protein